MTAQLTREFASKFANLALAHLTREYPNKLTHALAGPQDADPEGGEGPRLRDRVVGRVLAAATAQRFAEARQLAKSIGDADVSSQVNTLIDFAQSPPRLGTGDGPPGSRRAEASLIAGFIRLPNR